MAQIELTTPVVEPAKDEKIYNVAWYKNISILAKSPTEGTIYFERVPATTSLEMHPTTIDTFRVYQLWECVAAVPEAAAAMQAVLTALPKIEEWLDAQNNPPPQE